MAHFLIVAEMAGLLVTYSYADAKKAFRKVQTLNNRRTPYTLKEDEREITVWDLESRVTPKK